MLMMNPVCIQLIKNIIVIICMVLQVVCGDVECIEREREALLEFKAGIVVDPHGMLSSWTTPHCCQWEGIHCDNVTGHIIMLDLQGEVFNDPIESAFQQRRLIGGEIRESLMELNQLYYLNLSYNSFSFKQIPHFLASLSNLRYLDLSNSQFGGKIPSQLGSLFRLKYLNLASNSLEGSIPPHLGNLSKLQHLDLSLNFLNGKIPSQLGNLYELQHLDLVYNYLEGKIPSQLGNLSNLQVLYLGGRYGGALKIDDGDKWLSNLISLTHLYLYSMPTLNTAQSSLQMIVKLPKLRELSLINCSLSDHLILSLKPFTFNFSTSLSILDLSFNTLTSSMIFEWVSNITSNLVELNLGNNFLDGSISNHFGMVMNSLQQLDLSYNGFKGEVVKSFMNICTLHSLNLESNILSEDLSSILHNLSTGCVRYSLQRLDLAGNQITGCLPDLSIFSSLKALVLDRNQLSGKISDDSRLPSQFEYLSIRSNNLQGGIPISFKNACALRLLDMSNNSLSEEFPVIIYHLSGCASYSLEQLHLAKNQINGTLPDLSLFFSLKELYLHENKLNGEIPKDIAFPPLLEKLIMQSNSLKGVLSDFHFSNMPMLKLLELSYNSLTLAFTQNWVPPFQLIYIGLRSCMIGPTFPKWLRTQNDFNYLDISNAGISDNVPNWFWTKIASRGGISMNISHNNLHGIIPNLPPQNQYFSLVLRSNQFEGLIPPFLRGSINLDLSKNKFSDALSFVCANDRFETGLILLDLSNNKLSGQIPDCWSHFKSLIYLDLSRNKLIGQIPISMGSLIQLEALLLRNNNLIDEIPFSLGSCTKLLILDVAENKLSGPIPACIGSKMQNLRILSLGSNRFYGGLELQICYLKSLVLLDLSMNNLSGKIPKCINNFTSMAQPLSSTSYWTIHYYFYHVTLLSDIHEPFIHLNASLTWKGSKRPFENRGLAFLKIIDLSSNNFSGEIPAEIENLIKLISLNLSRNNLIGKIPSNIGKISSLESIDLSRNHLVGLIPPSLAQIHGLGVLDLSHNHLIGEIPIGTQLQSFNASSYEDNLDLCGPPLKKLCFHEGPTHNVEVHEDEYSVFNNEFYISMAIGFVISFWVVFGSILFNRSCRHAYFKFLNDLSDKVYVKVTIFTNKISKVVEA